MIELESERLRIREITEADLPLVFPVHLSNPEFLELMEGSEGEAGSYDLARWQRDWYIAQLMPERHMLACYRKDTGEAVGFVEYHEEIEEEEGNPWFGVISIHKAHQRQGMGTETFQRMIEYFRSQYGWPKLRTGVVESNEPGLAFAYHIGFLPIRRDMKRLPSGLQPYIVFERKL